MANQNQTKRFFLIQNTSTKGEWFYVVNKSDLLLTDDLDIKIGLKVQFLAEKKNKKTEEKRIRVGKILMESENDKNLDQEKKKRLKEIEEQKMTKEEAIENEKLDYYEKRLKFIERTRQEHVALAVELEKELNLESKIKRGLNIGICKANKINEKANEAILQIQQDSSRTNI